MPAEAAWLVPALIGLAILEPILAAIWIRPYFVLGLPIFVTEVEVEDAPQQTPTPIQVERHVREDSYVPFVFHKGAETSLLFREKLIDFSGRFSYTPVMHGRIVFDHQRRAVIVTGMARWSALFFLGAAAYLAPAAPFMRFFALFALLLFVPIYAVQAWRFKKVAATAASQWKQLHSTVSRGVS